MTIQDQLQHKIDFKTKPQGSLGRLEELAKQIGTIQKSLTPSVTKPTMLVFAGDHGIASEGVSLYPKEVTAQMVMNFLAGGAAINIFCKSSGMDLKVIDAGVDFDFPENNQLIHAKIKKGTNNILKKSAMSAAECLESIEKGKDIVSELHHNGCNTVAFGEMGIGNTSSAALIMNKLCKIGIDKCTGRGTGHDEAGLRKKTDILIKALSKHPKTNGPLNILATFGGFEIAMMTGAMLRAAELNMIILVDGFITTSALLVAHAMNNTILDNCIFSHQSDEQGHKLMLDYLGVKSLLNLAMRLGEGSGAALALPIVQSAVNFLNEMASFEEAGVSNKE